MNAERATAGDGSSLSDLASVPRELLDFLVHNRLEAVRIDASEDEAQSNSDGSDDSDAATVGAARSTARRKFVLRRRRDRGSPSAQTGASSSSAPADTARGEQSNALSDLASVTEMLEFLAQNGLEGVRIEPPYDDDTSSDDDDEDGAREGNPVKKNRLHDLANVREMLEFLAQNRLERVRIEIPTTDKPLSSSSSSQPNHQPGQKNTKKRRRSAAVLEKDRVFAKTVYYKTLVRTCLSSRALLTTV